MGAMDDLITADAPIFVSPDMMPGSETVVVTPPASVGAPRTINAGIWRDPPTDFGEGKRPKILALVVNSATLGISQAEFSAGGRWTVTVSYQGKAAEPMQINRDAQNMEADAGLWWVEVG